MSADLFEQLNQIHKHQPVLAGDLISKPDNDELKRKGWVFWYQDDDNPGYCLTEAGLKMHGAMLLAKRNSVTIGGGG